MIISPCISICKTDPVTGYCYGCGRNNDEKKLWKNENTNDEWKKKNLDEIKKRLNGWQLESFLESYEKMINLGSKTGSEGGQFNIHRPLINMKKTEIISIGKSLGLDYRKTISCYQATSDGKACGVCESCLFRKNAFLELGLEDETIYV